MSNFFKRWSSLKAENSAKENPPEPKNESLSVPLDKDLFNNLSEVNNKSSNEAPTHATESATTPKMADVQQLTIDSDFSSFMNKDVAGEVHQAAMKKLFSDPHFNVMDGLDIYIDDYSIEDPMPTGMLEKMYQSATLGLFKSTQENYPDQTIENVNPSLPASPSDLLPNEYPSSEGIENKPASLDELLENPHGSGEISTGDIPGMDQQVLPTENLKVDNNDNTNL